MNNRESDENPQQHVLTADSGNITVTPFTAELKLQTFPPEVIVSVGLVRQSVVVFGPKTAEGHRIEAIAFPWFEIVELLQKDPLFPYQIDSRKWEEIVAGSYERAGFKVILTPRSADLGRDIIAEREASDRTGTLRIIDQVKAYGPDHLVKADEVRALVGVLAMDLSASKGYVTTTSDFAPKLRQDQLISPLIPTRLELLNGTQLIALLGGLNARDK